MKVPRNILRSIRISEELFREIDKFQGDSWNDKINNLLDFYITQHKEYLNILDDLENQIQEKKELLNTFKKNISEFENLLN